MTFLKRILFSIFILLFGSSLCERCPRDWIRAEFHSREIGEFNVDIHRFEVKISLRITANEDKSLRVCGRIYTDEYYAFEIPSFGFYFREKGNRANSFFESSEFIITTPIRVGQSFTFNTVINTTEGNSFKNLPRVLSIVSLNQSVFFVQDYFYISSAFFSTYFLSKSADIVKKTKQFGKICIPIFGTSGHGKDCFASHMRSITTPIDRMLHPSSAGKGVEQTTNTTHPQFIVGDTVQILQTVGFQERTENDCSKIEKYVNDTIQGQVAEEFSCYPFTSLYIISSEQIHEKILHSHFCTVKFITGILNSRFKHKISTYTLFNTKGADLSVKEKQEAIQKLQFKIPSRNIFFIDLNMDSIERDFEKDKDLMILLEDVLTEHLENYKHRKKIAYVDLLRNNKWETFTYYDLKLLDMSVWQYIRLVLWNNLTSLKLKKIWDFMLVFVLPHILRRYLFEFFRSFSPMTFDILFGLFGGSAIWSADVVSWFIGYTGFGLIMYYLCRSCGIDRWLYHLGYGRYNEEGDEPADVIRRRQSSIPGGLLNNNNNVRL